MEPKFTDVQMAALALRGIGLAERSHGWHLAQSGQPERFIARAARIQNTRDVVWIFSSRYEQERGWQSGRYDGCSTDWLVELVLGGE